MADGPQYNQNISKAPKLQNDIAKEKELDKKVSAKITDTIVKKPNKKENVKETEETAKGKDQEKKHEKDNAKVILNKTRAKGKNFNQEEAEKLEEFLGIQQNKKEEVQKNSQKEVLVFDPKKAPLRTQEVSKNKELESDLTKDEKSKSESKNKQETSSQDKAPEEAQDKRQDKDKKSSVNLEARDNFKDIVTSPEFIRISENLQTHISSTAEVPENNTFESEEKSKINSKSKDNDVDFKEMERSEKEGNEINKTWKDSEEDRARGRINIKRVEGEKYIHDRASSFRDVVGLDVVKDVLYDKTIDQETHNSITKNESHIRQNEKPYSKKDRLEAVSPQPSTAKEDKDTIKQFQEKTPVKKPRLLSPSSTPKVKKEKMDKGQSR